MNKGPLPPQAYTRDQLTAAYAWVQTQPDSIRRMAETSDALVALYLKAKRSGDGMIEAPVSEKNFKDSLKTLKAELDMFSDTTLKPQAAPIEVAKPEETLRTFQPLSQSSSKAQIRTTPQNHVDDLDPRSRSMLQKIQERFNLSSESEALRMAIVLGFERVQSIDSTQGPI